MPLSPGDRLRCGRSRHFVWLCRLEPGPRIGYRGAVNPKRPRTGPVVPAALTSMQVDITTRMGALTAATPTGFSRLDRLLVGGLRTGTLMAVCGAPGVGRTA